MLVDLSLSDANAARLLEAIHEKNFALAQRADHALVASIGHNIEKCLHKQPLQHHQRNITNLVMHVDESTQGSKEEVKMLEEMLDREALKMKSS